jgi:hypothetical protein
MGLSTSQKELREKMLSGNIYSPNTIYDLTKDEVTKTLNKLSSFGLDMRSTLLGSTIEKIADDTPLTRQSFAYYGEAMKMRSIDNIAHNYLPQVDFNNIFDPTKPVVQMHKDWSITRANEKGVSKFFKNSLGIYDRLTIQNAYHDDINRHNVATNKTGNAQLGEMKKQMGEGLYNRYSNTTTLHSSSTENDFKVTEAVYSEPYIRKLVSSQDYTSYVKDKNGNKNNVDKKVRNLADTISNFNYVVDVEGKKEGFGSNFIVGGNQTMTDAQSFLTYIDDDLAKEQGLNVNSSTQMFKFGADRGLLYYTQQIVNSGTKAGKNIAHNKKDFGENLVDGSYLYKGSSHCRSYTNFDQYNSAYKLIRAKGNGHESSVLGDSVMPKIYPASSSDSNNNLMFSIENLAWSKNDFIKYGIPQEQRGANGGRVMWFPPYGLTFSDNSAANYETTNLMGRIEPVYTYNGVTRNIALNFIILIDTPPHLHEFKNDKEVLRKWFANCLQDVQNTPTLNNMDRKPVILPKMGEFVHSIETPPVPQTITLFNQGKYFFENNKDIVYVSGSNFTMGTYEYYISDRVIGGESNGEPKDWANDAGLNMGFGGENGALYNLVTLMHNQIVDGYNITIDIEGRCSALWTNEYNAKLSYRRADAMMKHILAAYNELYNTNVSTTKVIDYNKEITLDSAKKGKVISISTSDSLINFNIKGVGEELTKLGKTESEKNLPEVKKTRYAEVTKLVSKYIGTEKGNISGVKSNVQFASQISDSNFGNETIVDTSNTKSRYANLKFEHSQISGVGKSGWDKLDYYKPTFHSQTPYNFNERIQFLLQTTRPRQTIDSMNDTASNNLFGKMPICVLRIGDYIHSKVVVNNVNIDYSETTWDMNPEGMGMQPMVAKVTMDLSVIGGMALEWPINKILTANDFNFVANGDFYDKDGYYSKDRYDYKKAVKPSTDPNKKGVPEDPVWKETPSNPVSNPVPTNPPPPNLMASRTT